MDTIRLGRHGSIVSRVALGCLAFQRRIDMDDALRSRVTAAAEAAWTNEDERT